MTKADFYKAFARLHNERISEYFETQVPFEDFINNFIYVNTKNDRNDSFCLTSNEAYQKLNAFLECDFYSSEILHVYFENRELIMAFDINIKAGQLIPLKFIFLLNTDSNSAGIAAEWADFDGSEYNVWEILAFGLEVESTIGSQKKFPTVANVLAV